MQSTRETKECTLMFYFASDNPLAISIISQLKAIKSAGHHPEANVIVHYDPVTEGTPTHIFDVNLINKLRSNGHPQLGLKGSDPSVRSLVEDKLWGSEENRDGDEIRAKIASLISGYDPPRPIGKNDPPSNGQNGNNVGGHREPSPEQSLTNFLELCARDYPARHYLLFILGHGVVVGNDVFLFDENAEEHSLKLGKFGEILRKFKSKVKEIGSFDLVGLHSCSVSSLEVAYELQDTAKYMIASQGTAFVGSWPYEQILRHVFEDIDQKEPTRQMLEKIFTSSLHNSLDFLLAGYPFDLCLCDLTKLETINEPLARLSRALVTGLQENPVSAAQCANLTVLAHWRAQSFYQEMYTDLYDFCLCLVEYIEQSNGPQDQFLSEILNASKAVMEALEPSNGSQSEKLIIRSEFAGPEYQYAHGLSLYFPWSAPRAERGILEEYAEYKISKGLEQKPLESEERWLSFLRAYLDKTMRAPRSVESNSRLTRGSIGDRETATLLRLRDPELYEDMINLVYTEQGPHTGQNALDQGPSKTDPKDPTGGECTCPSIKNYPRNTRRPEDLKQERRASITFSPTFFELSSASAALSKSSGSSGG